MPVSPWFYTNMPGYNKDWMWSGNDLWHDRWLQVLYLQPEFVQIISWNDFGEVSNCLSIDSCSKQQRNPPPPLGRQNKIAICIAYRTMAAQLIT